MNSPDRHRLRGFKIALYASVAAAVALQLWTGSHNPAFIIVPIGLVFAAYIIPITVRARRERRARGLPRLRVTYPLTFKVAGVAVLLGLVVLYVLFFTQKGQAFGGEHTSLKNAIEGAVGVGILAVSQWQRSIIRRQLGSDWSRQGDLSSSSADGGRRWS